MTGHLFQERFKAILVEKESYLLQPQLRRYLVRNPVVAGITNNPVAWHWSSYRATAGLAPAPDWLTVDWILGQFVGTRPEAQKHYREFVTTGSMEASPWATLVGQIFLGAEGFVVQLESMLVARRSVAGIPKEQRYAARPPLSRVFAMHQQWTRAEKDQAIHQTHTVFGYTQKAIADFLGVHYSTVNRAVKRGELNLLDCMT